jgi:hypothetical protein
MFFSSHKAPLSRLLLAAIFSIFLINSPLNAEQKTIETDPAAENWYQVEVILFDQKTTTSSESAPKDLYLGFPENWLELSDKYPNVGIMRRPIFDPSSSASISDLDQSNLTQRLRVLLEAEKNLPQNIKGGSTQIPEASIPYQHHNLKNLSDLKPFLQDELGNEQDVMENEPLQTHNKDEFKPVYEQPYQILDKKLRDLNDTARALNKRNYNVRFHQAWRFQIDAKEQSPWVLIKTQQEVANRHAIEGSLRFYKSRYLHFESDLWRIIFSNSETMDLLLPEIPQTPLNSDEKTLLKALRFSKQLMALSDNMPNTIGLNTSDQGIKEVENALNAYDLDAVLPLLDSSRDTTAEATKTVINPNYPIKEIWPIKQSKRLQEDEVYYIDHPYMGALVSIKSFEPVPINRPPQIPEPEEISELKMAE